MTREEREKAIKYFKMRLAEKTHPPTTAQQKAFTIALEALQEPERKKGQWIKETKFSQSVCSNCHKTPKTILEELPDYCPNCGAEMRGEEE